MTLRIIATGGTFDKHYNLLTGTLEFGTSHLPEAIEKARIGYRTTLQQLPLLDSLEMRDPDRQKILVACQTATESALVVVHGTDTMTETAAVLASGVKNKTVVLTGAMIPYEIAGSDALFNLGHACAAATILAPGVYISMNGTVFKWNQVKKNRASGMFEQV